tara:strand:- start:19969 stop:20739 length:771 start_codon:yes stop_codon:yes gene_type:complete
MSIKHGNFDNLAHNYSKYRPDYSPDVLQSLLRMHNGSDLSAADIGAGTGIWTRMLSNSSKIKNLYAVEPSLNMKEQGKNHKQNGNIKWVSGSAENTNLPSNNFDIVTMASSFHWAKFDLATKEFHRILKENGTFCALWNPRYIDDNPLLLDIENKISDLNPNIKRVSSGKSKFVEELTGRFENNIQFTNLKYLEAIHTIKMSKEQYLGAWMSVNDIQFQLGEKFEIFINYIEDKLSTFDFIEAKYITRAWIVKKVL